MTDRDDAPTYPTGPGHRCSRGPVPEAYAAADMTVPCPRCHAETYCVNPITGEPSHSPCQVRVPHQPDPEAAA